MTAFPGPTTIRSPSSSLSSRTPAESEGWTSKELREAIRLASERSVEFDSPAAIRQARDTLWHWWERYADRVSKPERARLLAEIVLDLGEVLYVGKGGDHTSNRC